MRDKIIIIGASGHGKVVADIAAQTYSNIFFLDDAPIKNCMGYPVVGTSRDFEKYIDTADFFVAIGNAEIRKNIMNRLRATGASIATLIHTNTVVEKSVPIEEGTVIMAGSVINAGSSIGKGCIINTCSSVDHDCVIENYVHVSVGAHVAGTVKVGEGTWIGIGATVSNDIEITSNCIIGAGAVVINDIKESGTYIGVPARKI